MLLLLPRATTTTKLALLSSSSSLSRYHYYCPSAAARQLFHVHAAADAKSTSSDIIPAETSSKLFGAKLRKHGIFSRRRVDRRHNGLPRTKIINKNNIKQQFIHLLSKLGFESCIVTILLFILHRFVSLFTTTLSQQQQSLCKFITTNLTRYVAVSVFIKLLTLQSQITTITTELSTTTYHSLNYLDDDWFLKGQFYVVPRKDDLAVDCADDDDDDDDDDGDADTHNKPTYISVRVRQVANDGSCLFHSIGARILSDELIIMQQERARDRHDQHPSMSRIIEYSSKLRLQAVKTLQYNPHQNFTILQYLNGDDDTEETQVVVETTTSLISQAATQYGISQEEYLTSMKDDNVWGGGPEIAALASTLQREIVLLETTTARIKNEDDDNVHFLRVRARFRRGDDDDNDNNAIYILCTNQRYPERYGRKRLDDNHFLAVFPSRPF